MLSYIPGITSFRDAILSAHNTYRNAHGAGSLKWSNELEKNAQDWADKLAKSGQMQHAVLEDQGENLASMMGRNASHL